MSRALLLLCLGLVAGCSDFPQIDAAAGAASQNLAYPELLPMDTLLDAANATQLTDSDGTALAGRAAALRRRADTLRDTPVN